MLSRLGVYSLSDMSMTFDQVSAAYYCSRVTSASSQYSPTQNMSGLSMRLRTSRTKSLRKCCGEDRDWLKPKRRGSEPQKAYR